MSYSTFTSESVCAGHPDKICDQISDTILDAILAQDPHGRVAVETVVTKGRIILLGEVTTTAKVNYEQIARDVVKRLGYTRPEWGFSYDTAKVDIYLQEQSPEIAQGVDADGAGDQGMMFGYACQETPELMPLPIMLAHAIARGLDIAQVSTLPYLRPDGKAQVTVRYQDGKPIGIDQVTVAKPHDEAVGLEQVRADIYRLVISPALAVYGHSVAETAIVVNGTGVWHYPGPAVDAGLTGRKIVVDTYGGYARVGGGAFSGKDPSKVDRSGAYAARYIAKNIVAAGLADRCEVGLSYYIGAKQAVARRIESFGTATVDERTIHDFADECLHTSVSGIISALGLTRQSYQAVAKYGHFGGQEASWEAVSKPKPSNSKPFISGKLGLTMAVESKKE
jgi:S-adenosylmethionine synthetase